MKKFGFILYIAFAFVLMFAFSYNKILGVLVVLAAGIFFFMRHKVDFYEIMSNIAYKKGDMDKCLEWLKKAYMTKGAKTRVKVLYGYLLLKTEKVEESEAILKPLTELEQSSDDVLAAKSNYALVLWKKGKLDEAVELLEEVFAHEKTTIVYGSLGYLLILKGDLDRALEINNEAYEYNSSDSIILDNLAHTYYLLGNMERSDELYKELIGMKPSFPEAYYNYSLVLVKEEKYNEALETVKKALDYKLSYLSNLNCEDIDRHIKEIEEIISTS